MLKLLHNTRDFVTSGKVISLISLVSYTSDFTVTAITYKRGQKEETE